MRYIVILAVLRPALINHVVYGRQYAEQQLSALFHRHAAVTPEAWLAYGEMCGLAHDVYGLDVPLPHIAPQPQDEGASSVLN